MFKPNYSITPQITQLLINIELLKKEIQNLPITPTVLASLRESARLQTLHYSTYIEGNRLTLEQVENLIEKGSTFPSRKRDEKEILGYYAALEQIKNLSSIHKKLTQEDIQHLHALVMGGGKTNIKPTPYRSGQNAIYDGNTKKIVYLPPEAKDLKQLMQDLIDWINDSEQEKIPCPLIAAIAHYQFATIHPYYDGNGRTARLFATLILNRGGYNLKGLYSLEEYYAKNLPAYYNAISVGPSHNYYSPPKILKNNTENPPKPCAKAGLGRAKSDITPWLDYFCTGMLDSFEKVKTHALLEYHKCFDDKSKWLRELDSQQQATLTLFKKKKVITSKDIQDFFSISPRTARTLCLKWLDNGFLILNDPAKKSRKYELNPEISKNLFD
ncbi:MAG: Fic family protein [bacterium]